MLKRNLIANYAGQAWTAVMGLAFIPVYIRYLGIESYGLIGLFAVIQTWLVILDFGLSPTLTREMARLTGGGQTIAALRDLLRTIESISLGVALLVGAVIAGASGWLAAHWLKAENLPQASIAQAIQLMGVICALRFIEAVYRSSLAGLQRQVLLNVINSIAATVRGAGAVLILAWVSGTIFAFFVWQALISLLSILALGAATYWVLPKSGRAASFSLPALRTISSYAGGLAGITFLALLLTQIDKVLLSRLLTLSAFGYYTLAAVVAGTLYMLVYPVSGAWGPRLAELVARGDDEGVARTYHLGSQLVAVGAGSVALTIAAFPGELLQLWTGDPVMAREVAPLLLALTIGNLLHCLVTLPYILQLAYGWTSLALRVNLVAVVFIVPAILWATPRYGALGAALIWLSLACGYLLFNVGLMHRRILPSEKWRWYAADVAAPLSGGLAAVLAARLLIPDTEEPIGLAATLVLAGGATLTGAALAAPLFREALNDLLLRRTRKTNPEKANP